MIATDIPFGYGEDMKPDFVTEALFHLGAWEDKSAAELKANSLNTQSIPEDDSPYDMEKYYVVEIKLNENSSKNTLVRKAKN